MKHIGWFATGALALATAGCSGGGGGSPSELAHPTPSPVVTPTASPVPTLAPTATPTPSPSPTPAPPASSMTAIDFASSGPVTFTVTQPNYAGAFSETDTCDPLSGAIASVKTSNANGTGSFTVTPVGPGTCAITVSGGPGNPVTVPVTVSAAAITVQ